jgi:hypothetical protein
MLLSFFSILRNFNKKDLIFQILNLGDNLLQDFIAVNGISEEYILVLDALYKHKLNIDGIERSIYRVKK